MRWLLKIAVSIGLLTALVLWADAAAVAANLGGAVMAWLLLAFATLTASTVLMARRWQFTAKALGMKFTFSHALAEYYIAQLGNMALPGGVVGDVSRAYRMRVEGDLIRAAQSVAAERLIGQIGMIVPMAAGFALALMVPGGIAWPGLAWIGVGAVAAAGLGAALLPRGSSPTARFVGVVRTLTLTPRIIAQTAVTSALLIFSFYACARATGTVIPATGLLTLIPLILCAMLIPLTIGGWGWREGAAAALFPLIGSDPSAGVAAGIAYGAMMTLAALPGCLVLLRPDRTVPVPENKEIDMT